MVKYRLLISLLATIVLGASQACSAGLGLELNKLEPGSKACRAYIVIENGTEDAFTTFRYDLVVFDATGIVARRLALETAPLPAGKTSLKVFDLDGLPCEQIGRILVNDVLDCADVAGARLDCLGLIEPSSRSTVPLIR